jgi:hypothetical protein
MKSFCIRAGICIAVGLISTRIRVPPFSTRRAASRGLRSMDDVQIEEGVCLKKMRTLLD